MYTGNRRVGLRGYDEVDGRMKRERDKFRTTEVSKE
jgi:hypothetical protein